MELKITFIYEPEDNEADPDHSMGLTEEGYLALGSFLGGIGGYDIEIEKL